MKAPKDFIQKLYQESIQEGRNRQRLAHSANLIIKGTLSGDKYINELIQNADDAGKICPGKLSATFTLTEEHLIFTHNGNPFSEKDIEGIIDIGGPERDKVKELAQTGNKGIGFKAIFDIADYVLIISNGYTFAFDENHSLWKGNSKDYPWQIAPIWVEKQAIPKEAAPYLSEDKVNFVFKLRNKERRGEISKRLDELINHPKILLFLRNTHSITVTDIQKNTSKKMEIATVSEVVEEEFRIKEVQINSNNNVSSWYIYNRDAALGPKIKDIIKDSDKIPEKYKIAKKITLGLAIEFNEEELIPAVSPAVFCFLPTEVNYPFKMSVNADFILDTARMHLLDDNIVNQWNAYLLKLILFNQFRFLEYVASKTAHWESVLTMLTFPDQINWGKLNGFSHEFLDIFKRGKEKFKLIWNLQENQIYPISEINHDKYQFIQEYGSQELKRFCAHPSIKGQGLLVDLGSKVFDINSIINAIKKPEFSKTIVDPEVNQRFIEYAYTLYRQIESSFDKNNLQKLENTLKEIPLILSDQKDSNSCYRLHQIKDKLVYFPEENLKYLITNFNFVSLVHPATNALAAKNDAIKQWLIKLGVGELQFKEIIDKANNANSELISFTRRLYKNYKNLDKKDKALLPALKLKTTTGKYLRAHQCYVSDHYEPVIKLEGIFKDLPWFVSEEYTVDNILEWKNFFLEMNVMQQIEAHNITDFIEAANGLETNLIAFTQLIFEKYFYDKMDLKFFESNIKPALSKLKLLTTQGNYLPSTQCYLSDFYRPLLPLEQIVKGLSYVAKDYVTDEANIESWKGFLKEIGVKNTININVEVDYRRTNAIFSDDITKKYIDFLDKGIYEYDPSYETKLYPPDTGRYPHQHRISHYFRIEFIQQLIPTPILWQMIQNHWNMIESTDVRYRTLLSNRKIPSSIHYFVHLASMAHYQLPPTALYSPKLKETFGEDMADLKVAEIANLLTETQLAYFGFKNTLSPVDCVRILMKIAMQPASQASVAKITKLYEQILNAGHSLQSILQEANFERASLKLLTQTNEFKPLDQLYCFISKNIELEECNALLLKKPHDISLEDFENIASLLEVSMIRDTDLTINVQAEQKDTKLRGQLQKKLPYLLIAEAHKKEAVGEAELRSIAQTMFPEIQRQLNKLGIFYTEEIVAEYQEVIDQSIDIWGDKEQKVLYYTDLNDHSVIKKIAKFLKDYLGLKLEAKELCKILELSEEKLLKHFKKMNVDHTLIEEVGQSLGKGKIHKKEVNIATPLSARLSPKRPLSQKEAESEEVESEEEVLTPTKKIKYDSGYFSSEETASSQEMKENPTEQSLYHLVEKKVNNLSISSFSNTTSPSTPSFYNNVNRKTVHSQFGKKNTAFDNASVRENEDFLQENSNMQSMNRYQKLSVNFLTEEERKRIGRAGEAHVYEALKRKYLEKYGANYQEEGGTLTIHTDHYKKQVTWCNHKEELWKSYDFKVVKTTISDNQVTKKEYLEVKATIANKMEIDANFSSKEWAKMEKASAKSTNKLPITSYTVYCVNNISEPPAQRKMVKIKNFKDYLSQRATNVREIKQVTIALE